jgi:hypothetical protein
MSAAQAKDLIGAGGTGPAGDGPGSSRAVRVRRVSRVRRSNTGRPRAAGEGTPEWDRIVAGAAASPAGPGRYRAGPVIQPAVPAHPEAPSATGAGAAAAELGEPVEGSARPRVIQLFPVPAPRVPSEVPARPAQPIPGQPIPAQRPADCRRSRPAGRAGAGFAPAGAATGRAGATAPGPVAAPGHPGQQWTRTQTRVTVTRARARGPQAQAAPLRLTRRGRIVLGSLAVMVILAVLAAVTLSLAGGVQASDHGSRSGSPYQGMHQIVVQPGQTLWSVASAAEPQADPRVVIQQIISTNALNGATVQAGQLLWVPKS